MTQSDDLELIRRALARRWTTGPEAPTPSCLDDDTAAALAEGSLEAGVKEAALRHVATCPRCRAAVGSVARALADAGVAREVAAAEGGRRWRWRRVALVALPAAAALALLLIRPRTANEPEFTHRAPTITAVAAPVPQVPVGTVSDARTLRWTSVRGADRYRVTLFDAAGRVVYETQLADTAAVLPDSVGLAAGRTYLWKVEARTGFDRWSASELVEFSLRPGARR